MDASGESEQKANGSEGNDGAEKDGEEKQEPMTEEERREQLEDTIWKCSAFGEVKKVEAMLAENGSKVTEMDGTGFSALHWAALNARVKVAELLLASGADPNCIGARKQTPLHWACIRASTELVTLLIRRGADPTLPDDAGHMSVHLLAQNGGAFGMLQILALEKSPPCDEPDNDGRTALHWAAYKGHWEVVRVLLLMGADPGRQDVMGRTPLHWASAKGKSSIAVDLARAGGKRVMEAEDGEGKRASDLAKDAGCPGVASGLNAERKALEWHRRLVQKYGLCVVSAVIIVGMVFLDPFRTSISLAIALAALFLLVHVALSDPGKVVSRGKEFPPPALKHGRFDLICPTCRLVQPLGAKHCSVTGACVSRFDHYCPWVANTVGKNNHRAFLAFLVICSFGCMVVVLHAIRSFFLPEIVQLPFWHEVLSAFASVTMFLFVFGLLVTQSFQVARNLTTNEQMNLHRYPHFHTHAGRFQNPFDRGLLRNCADFCFRPTTRNEDIERSPIDNSLADPEAALAPRPLAPPPPPCAGKH